MFATVNNKNQYNVNIIKGVPKVLIPILVSCFSINLSLILMITGEITPQTEEKVLMTYLIA